VTLGSWCPQNSCGHRPNVLHSRLAELVTKGTWCSQSTALCGRRPSHAHHVRFAQARALGMKVSDEFTVPLCSVHHDAVHRTGNERSWWMSQVIDPLKAAAQLWSATQGKETQGDGAERGVDAPGADHTDPPSELASDRPSQSLLPSEFQRPMRRLHSPESYSPERMRIVQEGFDKEDLLTAA
jgi:hypothetical protein